MTLFLIIRFIYEAYFRFPHFKIVKVGVREWVNRNTDKLTTYQIEVKTKRPSSELIFEELWIDEKKYKFRLIKSNKKVADNFSKRETLNLNIISEIKTDVPSIPYEHSKNALILRYTFKNKIKYLRFKNFREMDGLTLSGSF